MSQQDKLNIPPIPDISFQGMMQTLSQKKKQVQSLIKIMQDWKNIETQYSKKMNDLVEAVNKIINQKKIGKFRPCERQVFQNISYLMNIVSVQSKNLVLKIDDDMITEAKETIKKMLTQISNPKQIQKLRKKNLIIKRKSIEQTYASIFQRKKSIEDANVLKFITDQCTESNLEKRMKVSKRVLDEESQFKLIEFKLQDTINDYNTQLNTWQQQSSDSIKYVKQLQASYRKIILDIYTKAQLHRITEYKTILHQLQRISENQIQLILSNQNLDDKNYWQKLQIDDLGSFLIKSVKMIDDRTIVDLTTYSKNKDIKEVIRISKTFEQNKQKQQQPLEIRHRSQSQSSNPTKYYQNLTKFFIHCIQSDPTQQQLQKMRKLLSHDQKRRVDFITVFQKYRLQGKCRMKCSIRKIKNILHMFLSTCLKYKDGYCCRQIMVLLFTYYFVKQDKSIQIVLPSQQINKQQFSKESSRQSSKQFHLQQVNNALEQQKHHHQIADLKKQQRSYKQSQKIYLNVLVIDHPIWRRIDYWQSVLIEGVYEQLLGHRKGARGSFCEDMRPNAQQDAQMLKNIVFSQLLAISCNMKLLGRNQKQIIVFTTKFSKMFSLSSQRIKQIQKSLTTSQVPTICLQQLLKQ